MPEHGEPEGAPAAPIVYTGILGKLEDFDSKSDTITAYIERAQLFMDANNIPKREACPYLVVVDRERQLRDFKKLASPCQSKRQFLGRDCSHSQGTLRAQASDHIGTVCFQQTATKDRRIRC